MGGASIWHWIIVLLLSLGWIVPFWKILPRARISKWVSLIAIFPLFAIILLWVVAFKHWPNQTTASL
jgi:hypothetical protein